MMRGDVAGFVRACFGDSRPVDTEALREFTRTRALRDQLARVAEAAVILHQIDDAREALDDLRDRIQVVAKREIGAFNRLHLAQLIEDTGRPDAE